MSLLQVQMLSLNPKEPYYADKVMELHKIVAVNQCRIYLPENQCFVVVGFFCLFVGVFCWFLFHFRLVGLFFKITYISGTFQVTEILKKYLCCYIKTLE